MRRVCVDACLAVKWFLPEDGALQAIELLEDWLSDPDVELIAPAFFWYEVGTVLRKKAHARLITAAAADAALSDLCDLNITPVHDVETVRSAWKWAELLRLIPLYDVAYVAAAEVKEAQFWTADEQLVAALRRVKPKHPVFLLGETKRGEA